MKTIEGSTEQQYKQITPKTGSFASLTGAVKTRIHIISIVGVINRHCTNRKDKNFCRWYHQRILYEQDESSQYYFFPFAIICLYQRNIVRNYEQLPGPNSQGGIERKGPKQEQN